MLRDTIVLVIALAYSAACAAAAEPQGAQISGTWNFVPASGYATVQLELRYSGFCRNGSNCNHSTELNVPLSDLGLSTWTVAQPLHQASFRMTGDAGQIDFNGNIGGGLGVGRFTFTPSATYAQSVERYGIGAPTPEEQLGALLLGVTVSYVESIQRAGLHETALRMFIALRALHIDVAYVRSMTMAYPGITTQEVFAFRALHVTPAYLAGLASAGYPHLAEHDVVAFAALHIDGTFIRSLRSEGYAHPTPGEIIRLKVLHR